MRIAEAVESLSADFRAAGIDEARADARLLVAFALNADALYVRMHAAEELDPDASAKLDSLRRRRLAREPVSKITGSRGFWRLDLKVTRDVLDPRPDSETLIDEALRRLPDKKAPLRILDLGTGSGCLALALLCELPLAKAVGTDRSEAALEIARENARLNGLDGRFEALALDWTANGWTDGLDPPFDVIISNPPYIAETERGTLSPEVLEFDPEGALFGGADGLDAYEALLPAVGALLKKDGFAVFEFGKGQHDAVREKGEAAKLAFDGFGTDMAGIVRCIVFRPEKQENACIIGGKSVR